MSAERDVEVMRCASLLIVRLEAMQTRFARSPHHRISRDFIFRTRLRAGSLRLAKRRILSVSVHSRSVVGQLRKPPRAPRHKSLGPLPMRKNRFHPKILHLHGFHLSKRKRRSSRRCHISPRNVCRTCACRHLPALPASNTSTEICLQRLRCRPIRFSELSPVKASYR